MIHGVILAYLPGPERPPHAPGPDGGGTMYYMDPAGAMRMADFPKDGPVIYTNGGAMFRNNGFIACRSGI